MTPLRQAAILTARDSDRGDRQARPQCCEHDPKQHKRVDAKIVLGRYTPEFRDRHTHEMPRRESSCDEPAAKRERSSERCRRPGARLSTKTCAGRPDYEQQYAKLAATTGSIRRAPPSRLCQPFVS